MAKKKEATAAPELESIKKEQEQIAHFRNQFFDTERWCENLQNEMGNAKWESDPLTSLCKRGQLVLSDYFKVYDLFKTMTLHAAEHSDHIGFKKVISIGFFRKVTTDADRILSDLSDLDALVVNDVATKRSSNYRYWSNVSRRDFDHLMLMAATFCWAFELPVAETAASIRLCFKNPQLSSGLEDMFMNVYIRLTGNPKEASLVTGQAAYKERISASELIQMVGRNVSDSEPSDGPTESGPDSSSPGGETSSGAGWGVDLGTSPGEPPQSDDSGVSGDAEAS